MGNSPVPAGTQRPTSAPLRKSSRPGGRPSITRTHADGHCHKIQGMSNALTTSKRSTLRLTALAGLVVCLQMSPARAQSVIEERKKDSRIKNQHTQSLPFKQRENVNYDAYILGPGDGLEIELLDVSELSETTSIGPDGTIYLPRLRAVYVEGMTIEELRKFLTEQYKTFVRNPQVYIRPVAYRPVRIYVVGEVTRTG